MLQHAVVLLSTYDWTRGDWVWFTRLTNCRTLWDVWCRASRQCNRFAAAAEAAHVGDSGANGDIGSLDASQPGVNHAEVVAPPEPSIWSALTGARGIGVDSTNTATAETRREAAATHDEDWFINFANKLFEL